MDGSDAILKSERIWLTVGQATDRKTMAAWWDDLKGREPLLTQAIAMWIDRATGCLARNLSGITEEQLIGVLVELRDTATLVARVVLDACRQELLQGLGDGSANAD